MHRLMHVSALIGLMMLLAMSFIVVQACEDEDEPEATEQNTCPTNGDDDDDVVDDDDDDDTADDDTGDDDDDDDTTPPGEEVSVDSTSATWIDSGLTIAVDDEIDFIATGTIAIDSYYEEVTPDGVDGTECGDDCPLTDAPRGALVGRIGEGSKGDPFLVGSELTDYAATEAGKLYLIVNDKDYTNNEGSFTVYIAITTAGDDDTTDDDTTDDDTTDDDTTDDDTVDDDTV